MAAKIGAGSSGGNGPIIKPQTQKWDTDATRKKKVKYDQTSSSLTTFDSNYVTPKGTVHIWRFSLDLGEGKENI
ncbi:hypothetical protein QWY93_19385 [Echinicola jeungdonensis]|uniref:hypothetical protein n=1 Tax=Echinicola jeungdonensis TaxID=709343 RepID=UPI0025B3DB13|nr:hypothetical protein [Echinicola jeungdonensis]MDN3671358.1 hypothetical protein [Echinicola jeungdonensis]MDN3671420.1 hypothetical protein [Echinicola jeungdonensis]